MKLIILGGFLGSGKTSVLMPLAHRIVDTTEGGNKTKLAIIENEIGQVGVDNVFLDGKGYTSREMFNGCVCCSMAEPLLNCLCELEKNENPDWVILEATGLAYPSDIAENIWEVYDEDMSITTVILADASRWMSLVAAAEELVHDQITNANYIIVNKTDLVSEDDLKKVSDDITEYTDGKMYQISVKNEPDKLIDICDEIIKEIKSWE